MAGLATPLGQMRRTAALAAVDRLNTAAEEVSDAQRGRALAFARWHKAGASYGDIVKVTELGRSTVVDIVKWGDELLAGNERAVTPRADR